MDNVNDLIEKLEKEGLPFIIAFETSTGVSVSHSDDLAALGLLEVVTSAIKHDVYRPVKSNE